MVKMGNGWILFKTSTETFTNNGSGLSPCHQQCDKHSPLEFRMEPIKNIPTLNQKTPLHTVNWNQTEA